MTPSQIFVAAVVIILFFVLAFIGNKNSKAKRLSRLSSIAFGFIVAGAVFGENRLIVQGDRVLDSGPFYHGTRADLKIGDLLEPSYSSNYGERKKANYVYLSATLDAAIWGAELAVGDKPGRIYIVEPTGTIEDDPNLTDKKFPGNPTRSYRTRQPLRVVGEVLDWEGHPPELLQNMRSHLDELKRLGIEAINE
jgi:hypothetical protein